MRRNRLVYYGLLILSLTGISFYGGSVSFGFFFVCLFVPVVSLIYLLYVYSFFKIYQKLDNNTPTVNSPVGYYFSLRNESFFTFSHIRVIFFSTFSEINELSDDYVYELMPGTGVTRETTATLKYRGEYEIGIKSVEIRDFFNLFTLTYRNRETLRVNVKPFIVNSEMLKLDEEKAFSTIENSLNDSYKDILVREYVPGDEMRMINWKTSARMGKYYVHNRTGEQNRKISILFDAGRYNGNIYEFLPVENKILEAVIALTMYYVRKEIPVIVCSNKADCMLAEISSINGFDVFYERVNAFSFDSNTDSLSYENAINKQVTSESHVVYIISGKWSSGEIDVIEKINHEGIQTVSLIVDENTSGGDYLKLNTVIPIGRDDDLTEVLG